MNFNSIKVQLKLLRALDQACNSEFQFHKGTIKTCLHQQDGRPVPNFNSIKVQLKHVNINRTTILTIISIP